MRNLIRRVLSLMFAVASLATLWFNNAHADDWSPTPLWSTAQLSQARTELAAASLGSEAFFAGGATSSGPSSVVDIYNTVSNTWSTANLSQARYDIAATSLGNEVFFAGGISSSGVSNVVDIYNTVSNTWTTAALSQARYGLSATAVGNDVIFASGLNGNADSNVVDIYNTVSNTWTTATLAVARAGGAAVTVGNEAFFASGNFYGDGNASTVDIYNSVSNTWSTANLSWARYSLSATSLGNEAFFAGGLSNNNPSNEVDIYNTVSNTWSTATLSQARFGLSATSLGNEALFAGGSPIPNTGDVSNVVDIYNSVSNTWSTATLSQPREFLSATSAGNEAFFAGGDANGTPSNVVDIYSTTGQSYSTITSSKAYTLPGQTTVAGRMSLSSPGSLNLGTFNLNVGSMSGNAPIDLGSQTLTVGSDNTSTMYSGTISDAGTLVKIGTGTLFLSGNNTYTGGTTVNMGTLQGNSIGLQGNIINNAAVVFDQGFPGIYSGSMSGIGSLTKTGADLLALTGSNTYTGGTNVSSGTLEVDSPLPGPAGQVSVQSLGTLVANASIQRPIAGVASNSQIVAVTANVSLGDSTSYTGFNHAGTLTVGSNIVTLNSAGFANLGVLTTLSGGTLAAPNGVTLPLGGNLVGSGVVNGKIAAGYGSTINATGNLTLGDLTSPVGFVSNGELYTNANTVTLNSFNAANNQNAVVLGSLTQIDGGSLIAPNGILLENGDNLVTTAAGGTVSGGTASRFLNRGNVQGPSSASGNWLIFDLLFKGSTGQTSGRIGFLGGFATGDSPGVNTQYGSTLLGGTGTEFDIGGTTPGNSDNNYGQLNILTDPSDLNNHGDLILSPGTSFKIVDWNGFVPAPGEEFTVLTWAGTLSGTASLVVDPAFASHGIQFVPQWNSNSLVIEAVPEPSTLAFLAVGAVGLLGFVWRQRRKEGKSMRSFMLHSISIVAVVLSMGAALSSATARGQNIYVTNYPNNTIGEYTMLGAVVNASLVSGVDCPGGLTVSGPNLFVTNYSADTIGEYTTSGAVVNTSLVSGLSQPSGIVVCGSNLFVTNILAGTIGEYNATTGAVVNASLVTGLNDPEGLALSGPNLFVTNYGTGTIGEYTTSGVVVNASLISGLSLPIGIAVSGSNLFVVNNGNGTIGKYTTSGAVVNTSLVSGLSYPLGIAASGSNLFATNWNIVEGNGTIGEYTMSGAVVNSSLVSGLSAPEAIAVTADVPEPSSLVAWAGLAGMGLIACAWQRRRAKA